MTDEGQKAIEAAAQAAWDHKRIDGFWDSLDLSIGSVACARSMAIEEQQAAIRAYLAALTDRWVAPRPPGMNNEAWEVLKKLSPPPGLEE